MQNQHNPYQSPQADMHHNDDTEYEYAGFWIRVLASIGDSILLFIVLMPILVILYTIGLINPDNNQVFNPIDLLMQIFSAAVYVFFWVKYAGTPVKRLLKLKILDAKTGEHLSYGQAFIRYIGYIPSALVLCLGFIWVAFDSKKQGWHDKMAGSVVVKEIR